MAGFANGMRIAFYNLTENPSQMEGASKIQLLLTERGQILPSGPGQTTLAVYTLWTGAHFNWLIPCPEGDQQADYEWDQQATSTYFKCVQAPKDGACGYHVLAAAMNVGGVLVPSAFEEPHDRYLHVHM